MVDGVAVVPGERVFRRHPARAVMSAVVTTAVLSTLTLFVLPQFLPRRMDIPTRGIIVLVVALALTAAVWLGIFWFRNVRVVVRPTTVEVGRGGNREVFDRATTVFRSKITEHRTNGIRSGVTRALIVYSNGREIIVELPGFTRTTFNELMAVLSPVDEPPAVDPVAAARARAHLPTSFAVDASKERGFANGLLVGAVAALLVTLATVAVAVTPGFLDGELSALVLIAPFAGVAGVGLLIGAVQRRRVLRGIPSRIGVGQQGLRLDDLDVPYAQLSRIWLTPTGYPVRRLRLERQAGRSTTHVLGSSRVQMVPEYETFLVTVRAQTAHLPGLLRLDLE